MGNENIKQVNPIFFYNTDPKLIKQQLKANVYTQTYGFILDY